MQVNEMTKENEAIIEEMKKIKFAYEGDLKKK